MKLKKQYRILQSIYNREEWKKVKDFDQEREAVFAMIKMAENGRMFDWKIEEVYVTEKPKDML